MKPEMALKPLVFALAAVMAMAAQAGEDGNGNGNGNGNHGPQGPLDQLLSIGAGAGATVLDEQNSDGYVVTNQAMRNTAEATDSLNGSNGSMGGYGGGHDDDRFKLSAAGTFELAGSNTQQVLTRDGWKTPVYNNATITNATNGFSGNSGANVSTGVGNQQSNSSSIAAGCKACM
jgi:hypothetical protein